MAQLNLLVGDIKGNTERVIAAAQQAIVEHAADIIAFPELTLTCWICPTTHCHSCHCRGQCSCKRCRGAGRC